MEKHWKEAGRMVTAAGNPENSLPYSHWEYAPSARAIGIRYFARNLFAR